MAFQGWDHQGPQLREDVKDGVATAQAAVADSGMPLDQISGTLVDGLQEVKNDFTG